MTSVCCTASAALPSMSLRQPPPPPPPLLQLVVLSLVPFTFVISAVVRRYLVRKFHAKEAASFVWQEGDVPWSGTVALALRACCAPVGTALLWGVCSSLAVHL